MMERYGSWMSMVLIITAALVVNILLPDRSGLALTILLVGLTTVLAIQAWFRRRRRHRLSHEPENV